MILSLSSKIFLIIFIQTVLSAVLNINDFGALPNNETNSNLNSIAIQNAVSAAKQGDSVLIPDDIYFISAVRFRNISRVTIIIDGTLRATNDIPNWPMDGSSYQHVVEFIQCTQITITSSKSPSIDFPSIDGQGYKWWWSEIFQTLKGDRPKMLVFTETDNIFIENISLINPPFWNLVLNDVSDVEISFVKIHVDIDAQKKLLKEHGRTLHISEILGDSIPWKEWLKDLLIDLDIPTFPLNTDGIDITGRNVHVHDVDIINFDDSIVPKPSTLSGVKATCTENILIENIHASGVGMSIGSVPPSTGHNCVNNVTMRNVTMRDTAKGIYVKTNPGDEGTGIISNILFQDFTIINPIWWAIWIGPQQQHQPGWNWTESKLCALAFPLAPKCPTQPLVPIENITLSNVQIINPLLSPGVIRCNETRYDIEGHPSCRNIVFDKVQVSGNSTNIPYGDQYACWNVETSTSIDSNPVPSCFNVNVDHLLVSNDNKKKKSN